MNSRVWARTVSVALVGALSLSLGILTGCSQPRAGEVAIDYVDAIQSVQQSLTSAVPLLTGKDTYVRVYLRSGGADVGGVGARLTIDGLGTISPIGATTVTAHPTGYNAWAFADVLTFRLTAAMIGPGDRTAAIDLIAPAGHPATVDASGHNLGHRDFALHFGADGPPTLTIYPVRYGYTSVPADYQRQEGLQGASYPERRQSDIDLSRRVAENMLPLASLELDWSLEARFGVPTFDCREPAGVLGCDAYTDARQWGGDRIDELFPIGGKTVVVIQPEVSRGALHGASCLTRRGNHRINMWIEPSGAAGLTLAHELGHSLGLGHTPDVGDWRDPNYPRADGAMGQFFGWRTAPTLRLEAGEDSAGTTLLHDVMSYTTPQWISPYSYCSAMRISTAGQVRCPNSLDRTGAFDLGASVTTSPC